MNIFLFLSLIFIFTFAAGRLIEKIREPWIFAAFILGALLAVYNPFSAITSSETFIFLAQMGMYFLLFVIGFEIDLKELIGKRRFIFGATFFIILFEAFMGTLVVHYAFACSWTVSALVALSFATVGEEILIPILDEFDAVNTRLGQVMIGIGCLDDLIEIFTLVLAVFIIGKNAQGSFNLISIFSSIAVLFLLAVILTKLKKEGRKFKFRNIETLFLFVIFVLFLFLGIGDYAQSAPLAALLAGVTLKTSLPPERLKFIESEIRTVCYGLFAPVFFVWVGATMNIRYLLNYPSLIMIIVFVSAGAKVLASYIAARKQLGGKQSLLLGVGLSANFSTGIIIIKLLYDNKMISPGLYSVVIASGAFFVFIIPVVFSNLLIKWRVGDERDRR